MWKHSNENVKTLKAFNSSLAHSFLFSFVWMKEETFIASDQSELSRCAWMIANLLLIFQFSLRWNKKVDGQYLYHRMRFEIFRSGLVTVWSGKCIRNSEISIGIQLGCALKWSDSLSWKVYLKIINWRNTIWLFIDFWLFIIDSSKLFLYLSVLQSGSIKPIRIIRKDQAATGLQTKRVK